MLRYSVHVEAAQARFASIGQAASNYERILKRWGGYFKAEALKRADAAEGWQPLAESTLARLRTTRTSNITVQGKVREGYATALERHLIRQQNKDEARRQFGALAGTDRAAGILASSSSVRAAGRLSASADLQELRRLRTAGAGAVERDAKGKAVKWTGSKAVDRLRKRLVQAEKQRQRTIGAREGLDGARANLQAARASGNATKELRAQERLDAMRQAAGGSTKARVGGDRRKLAGHKLLGRVARSLQWAVDGAKVSTYSKVPWSEVHNAGGSAGHGAEEPPRPFLVLGQQDKIVLSEIVLDHLLGGAGT